MNIPYIILKKDLPQKIREAFYSINDIDLIPKNDDGFSNPYQIVFDPKFPFIQFHDFFMLRYNWYDLIESKTRGIIHDNKVVTDFNQIIDWINAYSDGFKEGYNEFKKDVGKTKYKTFSHAINYTNSPHNGRIRWEHHNHLAPLSDWTKAGRHGGYYYRAWFKIMDNPHKYTKLFEEAALLQSSKEPPLTKSKTEIVIDFIKQERPKYKGSNKEEFYRQVLTAIKDANYPDSQIPSTALIEQKFGQMKKEIDPINKTPTNR